MSILKINNLSHTFENKQLFKNASFDINNGEHVGIVGLNGAGKSTFINIIAGNISYDAGEVIWLNGIRYDYLDQHADIDRDKTVIEYLKTAFDYLYELEKKLNALYAEMADTTDEDKLEKLINKSNRMLEQLESEGFYEIDSRIKKAAGGLGVAAIGYDKKIGTLSGGQRAKVMLCKLILENPDVMLLDEPTNFLDVEHIDWLEKYLCSLKKTYIVISNDTDFLDAVCDHIVSIANSRKKMLERIDVMQKPVVSLESHFSFPCEMLNTRDMLKVDKLVVGYDSPLLPPISFEMRGDTKLWIWGANGIGKSTLLKTLMGIIPPLGGTYNFHIAARPAYLEQDLKFSDMNINSFSYISECFPRFNQKEVRSQLARVGIRGEMSLQPIKTLSGGEQVRVKLLTIMNRVSNILILDEPTNHLDVAAKESLKKAIAEYAGAVILVSHDRAFADSVCDMSMRLKEL